VKLFTHNTVHNSVQFLHTANQRFLTLLHRELHRLLMFHSDIYTYNYVLFIFQKRFNVTEFLKLYLQTIKSNLVLLMCVIKNWLYSKISKFSLTHAKTRRDKVKTKTKTTVQNPQGVQSMSDEQSSGWQRIYGGKDFWKRCT